jgi:glycosyltransferase involved in cell wall biosynthesis
VERAVEQPDDARPRVALISNMSPHYRRPLYELLAARLDLDCFFFADDEPYWNSAIAANVPGAFRRIPMRRLNVLGEPLLPGLVRRLDARRYDAVIAGLTGRLMVPYVYGLARARHLPFVLWTGLWHHPDTAFHRATRPLVHAIYRGSDAIVVYGDHVRRALVSVPGVADAKIFRAAQAVDAQAFDTPSDPAASRAFGFVGQFEERKGIRELLEAFGRVRDETIRLELVGNGSLEPLVRAAASRDPRLSLVGHVGQRDLPARLATWRALVLPSITTPTFREPWGLVVNEAMHAGLPVISSDAVGAAADGLVADGVTGSVVPERDVSALAAALEAFASDDELVRSRSDAARRAVAAYTFANMADAFEAAVAYARARKGV